MNNSCISPSVLAIAAVLVDREGCDRKREYAEWLVRRRFFPARLRGSLRIQCAEIDPAPLLMNVTFARGGPKCNGRFRRATLAKYGCEAADRRESSVNKCHVITHVMKMTPDTRHLGSVSRGGSKRRSGAPRLMANTTDCHGSKRVYCHRAAMSNRVSFWPGCTVSRLVRTSDTIYPSLSIGA
jgi:hypothetical protein